MLIVCGSDSAWMRSTLVDNHDGLYGRLTRDIQLQPFTLPECMEFLHQRGLAFSRWELAVLHMTLGGVPGLLAEFGERAVETEHYTQAQDLLFRSMNGNAKGLKAIARLLSTRASGFTKREIAASTGLGEGGNLTKLHTTLTENGIATRYVPFGLSKRAQRYRLSDPFCLYVFSIVDGKSTQKLQDAMKDRQWADKAFMLLCCSHIPPIKKALGIDGVKTRESIRCEEGSGSTVLIIERADRIVNICQMVALESTCTITRSDYLSLMHSHDTLEQQLPRKAAGQYTMITTYGLAEREYSGVFDNVITLDDLFA